MHEEQEDPSDHGVFQTNSEEAINAIITPRGDERFPKIFVTNHAIPSFHRIYYFEVTLRSGSNEYVHFMKWPNSRISIHVGLVPDRYSLGTEADICANGYFFSFKNGKLTCRGLLISKRSGEEYEGKTDEFSHLLLGNQQSSLCLVSHGDTIGILYDQATNRLLLTKNDITIGMRLSLSGIS